MQYSFQHSHNEGSLKIYEPKPHEISHNIFAPERYPSFPTLNPQHHGSYHRQESLIDELENREEQPVGSDHHIHPKPTSIEFLVEENDARRHGFAHRMQNRIEDIFANKPALSSKEIDSSMFFKPIQEQGKPKNKASQIVLPSFPSKEFISTSPERPKLGRPFLRKKTTSKSSEGGSSEAFSPTTTNEQASFELSKAAIAIKSLKEYNCSLEGVYRSVREGGEGWRGLRRGEMEVLKLMIEKAIISK